MARVDRQRGRASSGTINLFCHVVAPVLAVKTFELELRKAKLVDDDVTIAYSNTAALDEMTIGWPVKSRRSFSILGAPKSKKSKLK